MVKVKKLLILPTRNAFTTNQEGYRYQFTGHEKDGETSYQYHGARYYDEDLARYMSVDRFAMKFFHQSPYVYAGNMPINNIDVNGDYSEDVAKGMAERGANNGYTTKVVANPDKENDFGVRFTKVRNEGTYRLTQFEGKFTGIGKAGLTKKGEEKSKTGSSSNDKSSSGINAPVIRQGPIQPPGPSPANPFPPDHLYYEVNAEKNSGDGMGARFMGIQLYGLWGQETNDGVNYNNEDGWAITGSHGSRDMGKRYGGGFGTRVDYIGEAGFDVTYTEYKSGKSSLTMGISLAFIGRIEFDVINKELFYGLQGSAGFMSPPVGYDASAKIGTKIKF